MFRRLYILAFVTAVIACAPKSKIYQIETDVIPIGENLDIADSAVIAMARPYREKMEAEMNEVIIHSESVLEKNVPEGKLGNFVTDACLERADNILNEKSDFCFVNNGGLRSSLPKGPVTRGNLFELMPFENELVQLTLDGPATRQLINFIADKGGMPVSGITFIIKDKEPFNIYIRQRPFDPEQSYKVVTSDYLANGGDELHFLANNIKRVDTGVKVRDVLIEYLKEKNKEGKILSARIEGRIKYE